MSLTDIQPIGPRPMSAEEFLDTPEKRTFLREKLESLVRKHKFDIEINNFVDEILRKDKSEYVDVNAVYKQLYEFTVANLPAEIQEAFYYDVRAFIGRTKGVVD
jgi:hypothetical protein